MSVSTKHPQYKKMTAVWTECTKAVDGQRAIKEAKETYLPATSGMKATWDTTGFKTYNAYVSRARFSDIPAESLEGALGVLFGKDPKGSLDEIVTNNNLSVHGLSKEVARYVYFKGRHILVIEAAAEGGEPYIAQYNSEDLINWKTDKDGNLTLAVFKEQIATGDKYEHDTEEAYREYTPDEVVTYDKDGAVTNRFPAMIPGVVPVVIVGSTDCSASVDKPPIARIVECALAAYRNSADYQQAMFLTAQPTPYSAGCSKDQYESNTASGIGAGTHWYMGEDAEAKVGYLEFSGEGIKAIKESQDAELAAAAEYAVKLAHVAGVEAASAKKIRDTAQKSALAIMAESISTGINSALGILSKASGADGKYEDFEIQMQNSAEAEATMITAMGNRVNAGGYPKQVEYNYAVKTGMYNGTYEEWLDQIDTGGAM